MNRNTQQDVALMVAEWRRLGVRPIVIEMTASEWFAVAAGAQVAMRHPQMSPQQVAVMGKVAWEIAEAVGQVSPALAGILEKGFDWGKDV